MKLRVGTRLTGGLVVTKIRKTEVKAYRSVDGKTFHLPITEAFDKIMVNAPQSQIAATKKL